MLKRVQKVESVVNNQPVTIQLARDYTYTRVNIRVAGTITVAGVGAMTLAQDGILNYPNVVQMTIGRRDGSEQIVNVPFRYLYINDQLEKSVAGLVTNPGVVAGVYPVEAQAAIDFDLDHCDFYDETLLNSSERRGVSSLELQVNFNSADTIYSALAGNTVTVTTMAVEVSTQEYDEPTMDLPLKVGSSDVGYRKKFETTTTKLITATGFQRIELPRTGSARRHYVYFLNAAGDRSDAVVNSANNNAIQLIKNNQIYRFNTSYAAVQIENQRDFGLAAPIVGQLVLNLDYDQKLSTMDSAADLTSYDLNIDFGAVGRVWVVTQILRP